MDAQELRNLQEAYIEVVENQQQLDEELTGERLKRAEDKIKSLGRRKSTADKRTSLFKVAYGKEGTGLPGSDGQSGGRKGPVKRGGGGTKGYGKVSGSGRDDMDRGYGNKAARKAEALKKEQVDLYDIILSHLLDEGYADTNQAALAIMANMSEEWKQDIVEAYDPKGQDKLIKKMGSLGKPDPGSTQKQNQVRADRAKKMYDKHHTSYVRPKSLPDGFGGPEWKSRKNKEKANKPESKKSFPSRLRRADGQGIRDSYDYYDIILSHLLDEGYAETPEAAEAIMVNMSEEWRQSIVG